MTANVSLTYEAALTLAAQREARLTVKTTSQARSAATRKARTKALVLAKCEELKHG